MPHLHPTNHCFDDALDFIDAACRADGYVIFRVGADGAVTSDRLTLVHGICLAPPTFERYAHGWVEEGADVWDAGLLDGVRVYLRMPQAEFYAYRQVQETTKYTVIEALRLNWASNHYGPWEEKYRALCGGRPLLGPGPTLTGPVTLIRL